MAVYTDREHYIPLRRQDLVELLCRDKTMPEEAREPFRQFCRLVTALYHFEYHTKLEQLKEEYAPFDPDSATHSIDPLPAEQREPRIQQLFDRFVWLMDKANYKKLSREELLKATEESSDWGLNLDIDFGLFEHLEVFIRGDSQGQRVRRHWLWFWKTEPVKVPVYERVVVILKLRPHKRLGLQIDTNDVYLKVFKDIPKVDIEMLLPGGEIKMPKMALGKLSLSVAGTVGLIVYKLSTGLSAIIAGLLTWNLLAFWGPLSLVAGYGYRQWAGYQTARQAYSLQLTQSLYYQNLDSNAGVLFHLLDEAEEQECREAILAYYYLWRYAGERGWTASDLDDYVELDLERLMNLQVDFEIEDALAKLDNLGLVEKNGDRYRAVPLEKALEALDYRWDNYFQYNKSADETGLVRSGQ